MEYISRDLRLGRLGLFELSCQNIMSQELFINSSFLVWYVKHRSIVTTHQKLETLDFSSQPRSEESK